MREQAHQGGTKLRNDHSKYGGVIDGFLVGVFFVGPVCDSRGLPSLYTRYEYQQIMETDGAPPHQSHLLSAVAQGHSKSLESLSDQFGYSRPFPLRSLMSYFLMAYCPSSGFFLVSNTSHNDRDKLYWDYYYYTTVN